MALTTLEKTQLDNFILNNILHNAAFYNPQCEHNILRLDNKDTVSYISQSLHLPITPVSVRSACQRLVKNGEAIQFDTNIFGKRKPNEDYAPLTTKFQSYTHFHKEKNRLYIDNTLNVPVYYDFITKRFYNEPPLLNSSYWNFTRKNIQEAIKKAPEWVFNYTIRIHDIFEIYDCYNYAFGEGAFASLKQPADARPYIEALDSHAFTKQTFFAYLFDALIVKKMTISPLISAWLERCDYIGILHLINLLDTHKGFNIIINQISKASSTPKNLLCGVSRSIASFIEELFYSIKYYGDNVISFLDGNRDFAHNIELLKAIEDKHKNQRLAEQMQRLNFIHKSSYLDKYVAIVPQSQEDKVEEGKMQHNCVGSFYDDYILKGEDLIYFLRKVETPDKSFITCRYNLREKKTVEFRGTCNTRVSDKEVIQTIKNIDTIITQNLK